MPSLLDALEFIRPAIASKDTQLGLRYVRLEGGTVAAANGMFAAQAPTGVDVMCLVDGEKLYAAAKRMGDDPTAIFDGDMLKVKKGRLRAALHTLPMAGTEIPAPDAPWEPLPPGLLQALRQLRPFVVDTHAQAWATGIYLHGHAATATTGTVIAEVELGFTMACPALVPAPAIDFFLTRTDPESWINAESYMAFRWPDGRWFRTQLLKIQYPNTAAVLEVSHHPDGSLITDAVREALADIAELSPDVITMNNSGVHGATEQGEFSHDCALPELASVAARWNPATLQAILKAATHWHPAAYPKPVPFSAPGLRGVAVGRT